MLVKAGSADRARIAQSLGFRVWGNSYGHPLESEGFLGCKLGTISRISTAAGGRSAGRPGEQGLWGSGGTESLLILLGCWLEETSLNRTDALPQAIQSWISGS